MFYSQAVDVVGEGHALCLVHVIGNVCTADAGSFCHVSYLQVWSEIQLLGDKELVDTLPYLAFLCCRCGFCRLSDVLLAVLNKLKKRKIAGKSYVAQRKEHDGKWCENGKQHPVAMCKVVPA